MKEKFPHVFGNISIQLPPPVFQDLTTSINERDADINSYFLSKLKSTTNKHLMPIVKCPWGCSEFMHKVGYLPIDIVYQRYIQKCSIKMITKSDLNLNENIISAREDYIYGDDTTNLILFNPESKNLPSIAFVNGRGPLVLTCAEHDNGTKERYIHTCSWQHNLSSKYPDQLCQAVVNPRLLKPVKASKYSNSFQLFHQTGSFNGIDTCTATSFGKFDFRSKLSMEAEARSISNRPDSNAHLSKLRQDGIISEYVESGKRDFAHEFSSSLNYS